MNISMNSATAVTTASADPTAAAAPAANLPGSPPASLPADPALAAASIPVALPFQQWLGLDQAAMPAEALPLPATGADATLPAQGESPETRPESAEAQAVQAEPLLGAMAMAMPMMPAALPAMMMAMPGAPAVLSQGRSGAQAQEAADAPQPSAAAAAAGVALAAGGSLPQAAALPLPAADPAAAQPARGAAPGQAAQPAAADAGARDGQAGAIVLDSGSAAGTAFSVGASGAPAAPARADAPVTLAGPPAAWRQSLQEALGERLQLQVGKHMEQAVIRLEPPMLGRIDISIRHAAGSLEVNISATHGEVLRQLNSVSDNLRNDLAQRQTGEVSVTVTQAPRAQAGAQAGSQSGADAQGRGRQPGQEQQERTPGQALLDAGKPDSPYSPQFSLNGRA